MWFQMHLSNGFQLVGAATMRQIFRHATSRIRIPGTEVVPIPLFEVLDAKDPGDYEQRVEPSATGGKKMAASFHLHLS